MMVALLAVSAGAWVIVLKSTMVMPATASLAEGSLFTLAWGAMMAAMMLPSAAPMILLYQRVGRTLAARGERSIPATAFAGVYVMIWLALGVPLYAAYLVAANLEATWASWPRVSAYLVSAVILAAGAYQFTAAKRACLRYCESPLGLLMRKWRSGYLPTTRLAVLHASYCIGCCWGLMLLLIAAGAMSPAWAFLISLAVFAEKVLPGGQRTARVIGAVLLILGTTIMIDPAIAHMLRGHADMATSRSHQMM